MFLKASASKKYINNRVLTKKSIIKNLLITPITTLLLSIIIKRKKN